MNHPVGVPMNDYMFALKDWPFGASVSHVGIARYGRPEQESNGVGNHQTKALRKDVEALEWDDGWAAGLQFGLKWIGKPDSVVTHTMGHSDHSSCPLITQEI